MRRSGFVCSSISLTEAKTGNGNTSVANWVAPAYDLKCRYALIGGKVNVPEGFSKTRYGNSIRHEVI